MALALPWMIPGGAWGADLYLSVAAALEYDSNVLRTEDDERDDAVLRIAPRLELSEEKGSYRYSLAYEVPYQSGFAESEVNDFSHLFLTEAGYAWGGRNDLLLRNNLRYQEGINNRSVRSVEDDDEVLRVNDADASILTNDLTLSYDRNLTPRLVANLTLTNRIFETDQDSRSDYQTYGASGSLGYALSSKQRVGGGVGGGLQSLEEAQGRPSSGSTTLNAFGLWSWQIDSTTRFEVRGGPVLIDTSQDSPPTSFTTAAFPFVHFDGNTRVNNFFDSSGIFHDTAVTPAAGSLAVSNFDSCPMLATGPPETVIIGNSCETLGVLFSDNPADAANINTVATSQNTLFFPSGSAPGSQDDLTVTFFGSASISKAWMSGLSSSLSYLRRESPASGLSATATTLDSLTLSNSWEISELWKFSVSGEWTQRKSVSESLQSFIAVQPDAGGTFTFGFPVAESSNLTSRRANNIVDTQNWRIRARLNREIGPNATASLRYSYNQQSSKNRSLGSSSDFEAHRVTISFQYNFDPVRAW